MPFARYLSVLFVSLLITACGSNPEKNKIPEDVSESQLYQQARAQLNNHNYSEAIESLQAMASRYPFGLYATQGQLELIYAYYQGEQPEAAKATAASFIRLHPKHPNVDYAYYMEGLADSTADFGWLERRLPVDMSRRDPGRARLAFNSFSQLLRYFPQSRYAPDAKLRMEQLRNQLAAYEIHVANYYFKRKAYIASLNRAQYVVEHFQRTPSVHNALRIMIKNYRILGLDKAAERTEKVLEKNDSNADSGNKSVT